MAVGGRARDVIVDWIEPERWFAATSFERTLAVLSDDERARADRFHREADRRLYVAAHGFWRNGLARALGGAPEELEFEIGDHGRPRLRGWRAEDLDTNLSHTRGMVAFALSRSGRVGVDVEAIDRDLETDEVAPRVFAPEEIEWTRTPPAETERRERFFRLWTVKESYSKALGTGFGIDFAAHRFVHAEDGTWRIARRAPNSTDRSPWSFHEERLASGHRLAACAAGEGVRFVRAPGSG